MADVPQLLPEELQELAEEVVVRTDEAHVGQRVRVASRLVLQDKYARSVASERASPLQLRAVSRAAWGRMCLNARRTSELTNTAVQVQGQGRGPDAARWSGRVVRFFSRRDI